MKNIKIASIFKEKDIVVTLGVLCYDVKVEKTSASFQKEMEALEEIIFKEKENYLEETLKQNNLAYKKLGKDPKRYPNSANALIKRVIKGKGLYHINNVVDINNYISLFYGYSLGSYDIASIKGDLLLRKGSDKDFYKGIGKGEFSLENLPVLEDELGIFGSPTSDSTRAMTLETTQKVMTIIYAFGGETPVKEVLEKLKFYLGKYANVEHFEEKIITNNIDIS